MTVDDALQPEAQPAAAQAARPWYVSAILALSAVTLLLLLVWGYARLKSPYPFYGTAMDTPAAGFAGTDQDGRPYAFTPGAGGRAAAVFFGFTHCPNICPLTLTYLSKVRAELPPAERERLDVVFVSIDPARDTPARLKSYVTYFGQATGVNIPEPALAQTAKAYGVGYEKAEVPTAGAKGGDYQMNHTTATYLIGPDGRLRAVWDYTQLPQVERVRADVLHVLGQP